MEISRKVAKFVYFLQSISMWRSRSVSPPPVDFTLTYLNNNQVDCSEFCYRHSCSPDDETHRFW